MTFGLSDVSCDLSPVVIGSFEVFPGASCKL